MLFQHVAIAGLAHIDAPRRLSSEEINVRLKPTLDRLGIKIDVLGDIVGQGERERFDRLRLDLPAEGVQVGDALLVRCGGSGTVRAS